jgi:hypothetical protein
MRATASVATVDPFGVVDDRFKRLGQFDNVLVRPPSDVMICTMYVRTRILSDPELNRRGRARAAALGIPFTEYVRRLVAADLGRTKQRTRTNKVSREGAPTRRTRRAKS